jgi:FkbM family methyltransferase
MLKRIFTMFKRRRRARSLGFRFERAASFVPPAQIIVAGKPLALSLPNDGGTRTAFVDVLLDDCYGLASMPDSVKTVLDIRCHAGLFSIAARDRWPGAVIHAYEPNAAMRPHWERNAGQASVSVFSEAVGLEAGTVEIVGHSDSVQVRTVAASGGAVVQTALRDAIARLDGRIDVVKLDCEGAEWELFDDAAVWSRVQMLTMEYHLWAGYTLEELCAKLQALSLTIQHTRASGADFGMLRARSSVTSRG